MKKNIDADAIHSERGVVRYLKQLTFESKKNRSNPTEAEKKIWKEVLRRRQTGHIFLRQKPIHRFILDFYCSELNLAIEIDGGYHEMRKGYDEERDKFLKQIGIRTIRFTNDEVMNDMDNVKLKLKISLVKGRNPEGERD